MDNELTTYFENVKREYEAIDNSLLDRLLCDDKVVDKLLEIV